MLAELAVCLVFMLVLVLGIVELGRGMTVSQSLVNAAREGARRATTPDGGDAACRDAVGNYLANAGLRSATISISPTVSSVPSGTPIAVTVTLPYRDVSWLSGAARWLGDRSLQRTVIMRKH